MRSLAQKLSLREWHTHYEELLPLGLIPSQYGNPLQDHVNRRGDSRLEHLHFDNSPAALQLWNFLLTENERLHQARREGDKIIGTMKDLGTVPVLAYSLPKMRAFYPDGSWWTPCLMECSDGLLRAAEALGLDASFCPVRAMVPAFLNQEHFPVPDALICSAGAVCDDFSAVAQRLEHLGFPIHWWEIPRRRRPEPDEWPCPLPGGLTAPRPMVESVRSELERLAHVLETVGGVAFTEERLRQGVARANRVRRLLRQLRDLVHGAPAAPLPALEMLVAEMLALHFCSDWAGTVLVLEGLLDEVNHRLREGQAVLSVAAVRVFWINPVADLRVLDELENLGGRVCGTDYMFTHALDLIPEDQPPLLALAQTALADPMVGPTAERAARIVRECRDLGAEAVVISRIPGASHCAREGAILRDVIEAHLDVPVVELEVPPVCDAMLGTLRSRLQAVIEVARERPRGVSLSRAGPSRLRAERYEEEHS